MVANKINAMIAMTLLSFTISAYPKNLPTVNIVGDHVYVTTPTGKIQTISLPNPKTDIDTKFLDLTFSGMADLMILRDRGANQEYYDVYLYSKASDKFIYSKNLSNIPCLSVDLKAHELVGQCFHESACENWEERYSVTTMGKISLVERRGTYCVPASGQAYTYVDHFRNGKRISSKVMPEDSAPGK